MGKKALDSLQPLLKPLHDTSVTLASSLFLFVKLHYLYAGKRGAYYASAKKWSSQFFLLFFSFHWTEVKWRPCMLQKNAMGNRPLITKQKPRNKQKKHNSYYDALPSVELKREKKKRYLPR
jgi:hypothetical protein